MKLMTPPLRSFPRHKWLPQVDQVTLSGPRCRSVSTAAPGHGCRSSNQEFIAAQGANDVIRSRPRSRHSRLARANGAARPFRCQNSRNGLGSHRESQAAEARRGKGLWSLAIP